MKLPDPVAWRVEVRWADRRIDQTWRKYGDYGTLKSAESSQQRFASPGDIESRIIPLYPEYALREARLAVLREELAAAQKMLLEAADEIADWGSYASEYFQDKHDLAGTIKRVRDAAMAKEKRDE